jgi:transcription elongation factor GreB
VVRPEVTRKVTEAAAMGDRSENAEYIYGKRQLRQIDSRVRLLSKRLEELVVVDKPPSDPSRVFFGAWVTVEDEDGHVASYRIVGADEFDPGRHYISVDSPLARTLLGKAAGDEVTVSTPEGSRGFSLRAVHYGAPPPGAMPAAANDDDAAGTP